MKQNGKLGTSRQLYEIGKSTIQGRGVFAAQRLRPGQKIIEYTGDIIPNDEADRRYDDDKMERHHTFLFTLDNERCIDGDVKTNDARLINHSCDPNCDAVIEDGRIWIDTIRDIAPGEELAYDYAYTLEERHPPAAKRRFPCHCGSAKCRGTILAKKR